MKEGDTIVCGNNSKGIVVRVCNIGNNAFKLLDVLLVDDLGTILSPLVNCLTNKYLIFKHIICSIISPDAGSTIFIENRYTNVCTLDLISNGVKYMVARIEDANL